MRHKYGSLRQPSQCTSRSGTVVTQSRTSHRIASRYFLTWIWSASPLAAKLDNCVLSSSTSRCLKRLLVMGHVIVGYARSLAMLSSITQPELRSITAGCVVISFCETWQRKRTSARFAFAT